jgi:hypothetical protein
LIKIRQFQRSFWNDNNACEGLDSYHPTISMTNLNIYLYFIIYFHIGLLFIAFYTVKYAYIILLLIIGSGYFKPGIDH